MLSSREISVLELLAEGASTTEAAEALHLSEYTVRDYVSNIMKRLNARNRTEAAVKAIRLGIIK
ncbi:response regulator transcription factor [Heyndrickxia sporothermodurans]|uniref:response regulator transcription factor n=1 Tax=Heyndrickxia sporothermodurans TaxID=46224 RepID=UPI001FCFE090|nr:LuxR C-terminal-related transcriptional regulator [Heyndrickxia sporothermodurans]